MKTPGQAFKDRFLGFATRLRFPWLVAIIGALFAADLVIPDLIPFVDEILLGLLAALLATIKKGRKESFASATVMPAVEQHPPAQP